MALGGPQRPTVDQSSEKGQGSQIPQPNPSSRVRVWCGDDELESVAYEPERHEADDPTPIGAPPYEARDQGHPKYRGGRQLPNPLLPVAVVGNTLSLCLGPNRGESRVGTRGYHRGKEKKRYAHLLALLQDGQESPGDQEGGDEMKEAFQWRDDDDR